MEMETRPNVVLIMTDQHRADCLGAVGHPLVRTRNLDALAAQSVLLEQAYCTTPLCVPSRTTIFTSQHASRHAHTSGTGFVNDVSLGDTHTHLPSVLRNEGYDLALVGKNHAFLDEYLETWDFCELYDLHGKEEKPFCSKLTSNDAAVRSWRQDTSIVPEQEGVVHVPQPGAVADDPNVSQTEHALRFLSERDRSRPFFLYFSFESPHFPNVVPEPFFSLYNLNDMPGCPPEEQLFGGKPLRLFLQYYGQNFDQLRDADYRRIQASYLAQISLVDSQIGRVLSALKTSGEWDHTLIIFVSDHGDFWGNHGLVGKTNACYEDLLRIPMMWKLPGTTFTGSRAGFCDTSDVFPTILDLMSLPLPDGAQGASLFPVFRGDRLGTRDSLVAEAHLHPGPAPTREEISTAVQQRKTLVEREGRPWFGRRLNGWVRSIQDADGLKLITNENDMTELYDLRADPDERTNILDQKIVSDSHRRRASQLLTDLEKWSYA